MRPTKHLSNKSLKYISLLILLKLQQASLQKAHLLVCKQLSGVGITFSLYSHLAYC